MAYFNQKSDRRKRPRTREALPRDERLALVLEQSASDHPESGCLMREAAERLRDLSAQLAGTLSVIRES